MNKERYQYRGFWLIITEMNNHFYVGMGLYKHSTDVVGIGVEDTEPESRLLGELWIDAVYRITQKTPDE